MPIVNPIIRMLVLVICGLVGASAVPVIIAAAALPRLAPGQPPAFTLLGFEVIVLIAAVLGVLLGRGRYMQGPGLALACVAGTIFAGSALGWQGAGRAIGDVSLTPLLIGRLMAGLALGALAGLIVLNRHRGSWVLLIKGVAFLLPVVVGLGALLHGPSRLAIERVLAGNTVLSLAAVVFGFLLGAVLLAVGGHCVIRAFELGRMDPGPSATPVVHEAPASKA